MTFLFCCPPRDEGGHVPPFEAAVDVHDHHIGGTTVEHRQQGGYSAEDRAITDACWHRNYGAINQSAHDARQGSVHPGNHDYSIRIRKLIAVAEQTVNARHADIGDQRHRGS